MKCSRRAGDHDWASGEYECKHDYAIHDEVIEVPKPSFVMFLFILPGLPEKFLKQHLWPSESWARWTGEADDAR